MPARRGDISTCESCGVEIVFLRHTRTGNLAPIEAKPDPSGRYVIDLVTNTYALVTGMKSADMHYHENHYVRCPQAKFWRTRGAKP
jgi:hypothetical protein